MLYEVITVLEPDRDALAGRIDARKKIGDRREILGGSEKEKRVGAGNGDGGRNNFV